MMQYQFFSRILFIVGSSVLLFNWTFVIFLNLIETKITLPESKFDYQGYNLSCSSRFPFFYQQTYTDYVDLIKQTMYLTHLSKQAVCDTMSILRKVYQLWIQSFPSPKMVANQRLNNPVCLTIYHSWRENNWIHTFFRVT